MSKFDLKKITKKFSKVLGKDKSKAQFKTNRDWGVLLIFFFTLLVAVAATNVYLFIQINKEEIFAKERPVEEEIEMLNTDMLKNTIEFFDNRAENFASTSKQKPDIIDPAL